MPPPAKKCLAPRKERERVGAASLRSSGIETSGGSSSSGSQQKSGEDLDKHASKLYSWLDMDKRSAIRGIANWQSGGGVSHVVASHYRAARCFRYFGSTKHSNDAHSRGVSLTEFQKAVRARHRAGDACVVLCFRWFAYSIR